MAVKKAVTTALVNYDAELAELAKRGSKTAVVLAGVTGKAIGTAGGRFSIDGKQLREPKIDVIVIDAILMNTLYEPGSVYDANNPASPICFAFGRDKEEMEASVDSAAPQGGTEYEPDSKQPGRPCDGCWAAEWGSAAKGKGKACKNQFRIAVILTEGLSDDVENAETRYMSIPIMSTKNWADHVRDVEDTLHLPVQGVVTRITIQPGTGGEQGGGHTLEFSVLSEVPKTLIGAILTKNKKVSKEIDYPFVKPDSKKPANIAPAKTAAKGAKRITKY